MKTTLPVYLPNAFSVFFFFFSSRRRHTRYWRDWSSDVCSSDLTNNAGVEFTRSMGAEVQMVTIRGTNSWHGGGYWYHQNDEVNANDWFRNRRGVENPEWRDNRAGGKIGGPIWKDRTFFFLFEEERHFSTQAVFQRLVPSAALRAGILKFKDAGGTVQAFNLNPTPTLDPAATPADNDPRIGTMIPTTGKESDPLSPNFNGACDVGSTPTCNPLDPRNLGLSPAIAATWAKLPAANDFTAGNAALRAPFFTGTVPNIVNEHNAIFRLDHKINDKWDFMGKYAWNSGGRVQIQTFLHVRDDKVVGGITTPLYFVARGGQFLDIGGIPVPASVRSADKGTYRRAFISALGLVDSATQVLTRAGDLSPQPAGSTITQKENVNAYEIYFSDTWRVTPSLTFTYGLTWGVQMPPNDPTGKTAMMIDVSTGKPIDAKSYLSAKETAALNGTVFNPTVGYVPIKSTGRKYP